MLPFGRAPLLNDAAVATGAFACEGEGLHAVMKNKHRSEPTLDPCEQSTDDELLFGLAR